MEFLFLFTLLSVIYLSLLFLLFFSTSSSTAIRILFVCASVCIKILTALFDYRLNKIEKNKTVWQNCGERVMYLSFYEKWNAKKNAITTKVVLYNSSSAVWRSIQCNMNYSVLLLRFFFSNGSLQKQTVFWLEVVYIHTLQKQQTFFIHTLEFCSLLPINNIFAIFT